MNFEKCEIEKIENLRMEYFNSLSAFQDIFIELNVKYAQSYLITKNEMPVGYFVITEDDILIEFYLIKTELGDSHLYFKKMLNEISLKSIYCQSYDSLLLNCCMLNNFTYKIIGLMYREYNSTLPIVRDDVKIRFAEEKDLAFLQIQNDEVFEPKEMLEKFIKTKSIILFIKDNETIACGFITQINKNYTYYDLGVWVNPNHRKKGLGEFVLAHLKDYAIKNNLIPVCGCSIDNLISQRIIAKNGFISKHCLIEFSII